jgi:hypothetical protein
MNEPNLCIICDEQRASTREDIVPNWLRREARKLDVYSGLINQASLLVRMCEDCNSTFGIRYENRAAPIIKPLLRSESVLISPADQRVIARWVIKTVLFFALSRPSDLPPAQRDFFREVCRRMKREYVIPHQTMVRIGACNPTVTEDPVNLRLHNPGPIPDVVYSSPSMCASMAWELAIGSPDTLLPFANSCPNDGPLFRILPETGTDIRWPPSQCLTMQDIYYLRMAWQERTWPVPEGTVFRPPAAWASRPVHGTRKSNQTQIQVVRHFPKKV